MSIATVAWIRVDVRLPAEDVRVLVVYKAGQGYGSGGSKSVHFARFAGGQWRFVARNEKSRLPERITHWTPIPRLPRGSPKPSPMKKADLGAMDSPAGFYSADVGSIPTGRTIA